MVLHTGALTLLLIVACGSAYVLLEEESPEASIVWPTDYYFKAEQIDILKSRVEKYEVWYSGENNASRIDYFDGINKKYYTAETDDENGKEYNIFTIASQTLETEQVCTQVSHSGPPEDFMPSIEGLERSDEMELDGKTVQVWKLEETLESQRTEQILYTYRTEYDFDVPVKQVTKFYNLEAGNMKTYLITYYNQFSYNVEVDEVTVDAVDCENMDGFRPTKDFKADIKNLHPHISGDVEKAFDGFKRHHGRKYNGNEHTIRKQIFHNNWRHVQDHNSKNAGYLLELNEFADYTDEELAMLTGTRPSDRSSVSAMPFPHSLEELATIEEELPESLDMRMEGFMRPVRHQGNCGSCWAFAATAAVEGALSRQNGGRNLDLSEQSLVDCAWGYDNMGCNGGLLDTTFEYIMEHQIPRESEYGSYIQLDGVCHLENMTETFGIKGYALVTPDNPTAMKAALYKYGPVAVGVYASDTMFLYSSGIYYDLECDEKKARFNHAVVVVGYGERDGTPYWIIRNSWGESWGEDGYMLISAVNNNCFVLDSPYYPIV